MSSNISFEYKKRNQESDIFHLKPVANNFKESKIKPSKDFNLSYKPKSKLDKFINITTINNDKTSFDCRTNALFKNYRNFGIMKGGKRMFGERKNKDSVSFGENGGDMKNKGIKCNSNKYINQSLDHIGPYMDCSIENESIDNGGRQMRKKNIENGGRFKENFNNSKNVKRLLNNSYDNYYIRNQGNYNNNNNNSNNIYSNYGICNINNRSKLNKKSSFNSINSSIDNDRNSIKFGKKSIETHNVTKGEYPFNRKEMTIQTNDKRKSSDLTKMHYNKTVENDAKSKGRSGIKKMFRFSMDKIKSNSTKNINKSQVINAKKMLLKHNSIGAIKNKYIPPYLKVKKNNKKMNANVELCALDWCNANNEVYVRKFYPDRSHFSAKELKILENNGNFRFSKEGTIQHEFSDKVSLEKSLFLNKNSRISELGKTDVDRSLEHNRNNIKKLYVRKPSSLVRKEVNNISALGREEFYDSVVETANKGKRIAEGNCPKEVTHVYQIPFIDYDHICDIKKEFGDNGIHVFEQRISEVSPSEKNKVKLEIKIRHNKNDRGYKERFNKVVETLKSSLPIEIINKEEEEKLKSIFKNSHKLPNIPPSVSYLNPNSGQFGKGRYLKTNNPVKPRLIYNKSNRENFGDARFRAPVRKDEKGSVRKTSAEKNKRKLSQKYVFKYS